MRKHPFVDNSYHHVYNRGTDKRNIFKSKKDIERFLVCMKLFLYSKPVGSVRDAIKLTDFGRLERGEKIVSIVEYCLNPNHFHLVLKQEAEGGISEFMKRLQGGYTKYFNEKYKRSGVLFQGKFKSSYIEKEGYFELILAYVMWNYKIHNITIDKTSLIYSSEREYEDSNFDIIDEKEGLNLLDMFGDYKKFYKKSDEVISILKSRREDLKANFEFNES